MDRLPKCEANYVPLSPLTFLKRASAVYANRTSVIYHNTRFTWKETDERCRSLASSLLSLNIRKNDVNSQNANTVTEVDIIGHCRNNLSGFMIPKKVVFMDMIPRTATGKIQKNKLRAIAKILTEKVGEQQKPSNKNTKVIKRDQPFGYEDQHQEKIFAKSRL